jgi:non-heme chloroperoxidase
MSCIDYLKSRAVARILSAVLATALALLAHAGSTLDARTVQDPDWHDPSPHAVLAVPVTPDMSLEVLDWGGRGRAVVLLAGLGNTAHIFDEFAPKLAKSCHVYGITRRGFGASSAVPPSGYTSDRLAEDVLEVADFLKLHRPILVGHSFAGEEMTLLGTEHPSKIAGLIYLDAAYDRTTAASARWNALATQTRPPPPTEDDQHSYSALQSWYTRTMHIEPPEADLRANSVPSPMSPIGAPRTPPSVYEAILSGVRKPDYSRIHLPALAIYAVPHSIEDTPGFGSAPQAVVGELFELQREEVHVNSAQFRSGNRHARVIEIQGATHFLFLSNQADALREVRAFVIGLP